MQIPFEKISSGVFSAFLGILSLSKLLKKTNNKREEAIITKNGKKDSKQIPLCTNELTQPYLFFVSKEFVICLQIIFENTMLLLISYKYHPETPASVLASSHRYPATMQKSPDSAHNRLSGHPVRHQNRRIGNPLESYAVRCPADVRS